MGSSLAAALTLAAAMAVGVLATALARRARVPSIVLLLATGVILGPDVAGVIDPSSLGGALTAIVGFGVAVILFEGGLNQNISRLRREAVPIRRLVTIGALVTTAGGALAAYWFLGWDWRMSLLFGSLVVVTGPTVITPLLRRVKVRETVETVLEAEGVFIDAVGAVLAVAALGFVLAPSASSLGVEAAELAGRLGTGAAVGALAGGVILVASGPLRLLPSGLENIFALSLVILAFHVSNTLFHESGIAASLAAGMVVGNSKHHQRLDDLLDFKEQLTVLLVAVLFVLLAADVRLAEVTGLGWGMLGVLAMLMFAVRPLDVWISTAGTEHGIRERAFIAWLAPRGIVAAAVASLFASDLEAAGIAGGAELRAAVFVVIAATVTIQGLSCGLVASALGLRRDEDRGFAIVGANSLGVAIATALRDAGEEVVLIDSNPQRINEVSELGFDAIHGNALRDSVLGRARVGDRKQVACVTSSDKLNVLVARLVDEHGGEAVAAISGSDANLGEKVLGDHGDRLLFGGPIDVADWCSRLTADRTSSESRSLSEPTPLSELDGLPLIFTRDGMTSLIDDYTELEAGDQLRLLPAPA